MSSLLEYSYALLHSASAEPCRARVGGIPPGGIRPQYRGHIPAMHKSYVDWSTRRTCMTSIAGQQLYLVVACVTRYRAEAEIDIFNFWPLLVCVCRNLLLRSWHTNGNLSLHSPIIDASLQRNVLYKTGARIITIVVQDDEKTSCCAYDQRIFSGARAHFSARGREFFKRPLQLLQKFRKS